MKSIVNEAAIAARLDADYDYLSNAGYEVVCVCLAGSQNYGISTAESDIDTKAIVLPTFRNLATGHTTISFTHVEPDGSRLEVKDISSMFACIRKQNINFLEILCTKYRKFNPRYESSLMPLFDLDAVFHYNPVAAIRCMAGTINEKCVRLMREQPTGENEAETISFQKYGYDVKTLCHIYRIFYALDLYNHGYPFRMCIVPTGKTRDQIMYWRAGERVPSREDAIRNALDAKRKAMDIASAPHIQDDQCLRHNLENSILICIEQCFRIFLQEYGGRS